MTLTSNFTWGKLQLNSLQHIEALPPERRQAEIPTHQRHAFPVGIPASIPTRTACGATSSALIFGLFRKLMILQFLCAVRMIPFDMFTDSILELSDLVHDMPLCLALNFDGLASCEPCPGVKEQSEMFVAVTIVTLVTKSDSCFSKAKN